MADIQVTGFVSAIKYLPGAVFVFVNEYKKGYRKQNGEIVDDKCISWKIIFKAGMRNYISKFFNNGMLVTVKGEVFPYAIEKEELVDGYSFIGQCMNLSSYPRLGARDEKKMVYESQLSSEEKPDLDAYNQPDF